MELGINKPKLSVVDYIQKWVYVIMRQCPTAHLMFGKDSIWDITSVEFNWIIEQLADENTAVTKENNKKRK